MNTLKKLAVIAPLLLAGGCAIDADESMDVTWLEPQNMSDPLQDGEERFGEGVTPFADIQVADSRYVFVEMADENGHSLGVGSVNILGPNSAAASQDDRLADASPLDFYLAITPEGTAIPSQLAVYERELAEPQGWLIEKMESEQTTTPRGICVNSTFKDAIRNLDPDINDETDWSLNQTPSSGNSSRWRGPSCFPDTQCGVPKWHSYNYRAGNNTYDMHNLDEMALGAVACQMSSARAVWVNGSLISDHAGPELFFHFRTASGSVGNVFTRDLTQSDRLNLFTWVWWGAPVVGNEVNVDWKISWDKVLGGDKFDMGMRGEHKGW